MSRRSTRNFSAFLKVVVSLVMLSLLILAIQDNGGIAILIFLTLCVGLFAYYRNRQKAARLAERLVYLRSKYGDEIIVQRIVNKLYWDGQTAEQLRDSLGDASSIDTERLRTKKREVWKYGQIGKGQYRLRITLDQDIVVGAKTLGR
jgi:hypothetical protein